MTVRAPAKLNLTLEVLGTRPDGYHALRSVVVPLSLADTLTLTPAPETSVDMVPSVPMAGLCPANQNLAFRAARLMQRLAGRADGVRIRIVKRIPLGGGLGGGSADAAAVLRALNTLWCLNLPLPRLAALGADIGSDVPALVHSVPLLMEGRGEQITPFTFPPSPFPLTPSPSPLHLVLLFPGVASSTAEIFARLPSAPLPNRPEILYTMRRAMQDGDPAAVAAALQNDLTAPACRRHPEIAAGLAALRAAGCLGVSMTGSGATVFGVARDAADARRLARFLARRGHRVVPVQTVR